MPDGPGTYGSKVGRPKKARTAKQPRSRLKPLTSGQKRIARAAGNPNKIEGQDFKALRRRRGM